MSKDKRRGEKKKVKNPTPKPNKKPTQPNQQKKPKKILPCTVGKSRCKELLAGAGDRCIKSLLKQRRYLEAQVLIIFSKQ